jgi:hypothetical protein
MWRAIRDSQYRYIHTYLLCLFCNSCRILVHVAMQRSVRPWSWQQSADFAAYTLLHPFADASMSSHTQTGSEPKLHTVLPPPSIHRQPRRVVACRFTLGDLVLLCGLLSTGDRGHCIHCLHALLYHFCSDCKLVRLLSSALMEEHIEANLLLCCRHWQHSHCRQRDLLHLALTCLLRLS